LNTGEHLPDVIRGAAGGVSWGHADGEVYYSTQDESHRSNKVWRHAMGTAQSEDDCVFVEDDELFRCVRVLYKRTVFHPSPGFNT
jgi:oligopeptidase B